MKKNNLLKSLLCLIPLILTSCGNNKTSQSEISSNEEPSISTSSSESNSNIEESSSSSLTDTESSISSSEEFVDDPNYYYGLNKDDAFSKNLDFSVTSEKEDVSLNLKIDDKSVAPLDETDWNLKLYYETFNCNSDNANRAADYIYLNGVKLGKIPSDGSKGINLNVIENDLLIGENVITVTIGGYWGAAEYDYTGPNKANCDDYKIGKMYVVSNTLEKIYVHKMVEYKWVNGTRNTYNKYESIPDKDTLYWVGDGWGGSVAYDGNPNERLNIAQKIDFYFNYNLPNAINSYSIDTTKYDNGKHTIDVYDDDVKVLSREVIFDNDLPQVKCNIKENAILDNNYNIHYEMEDNTTNIVDSKVLLDGNLVEENDIAINELAVGKHSLSFYCQDRANNYIYQAKEFEVSTIGNYLEVSGVKNKDNIEFDINNSNSNSMEMSINKVNTLNYTSSSKVNQIEEFNTNNPIQNFEVDVQDKTKPLYISYTGESSNSQDKITLSAYNEVLGKYEEIGANYSNKPINVTLEATSYVNNENKVKLKAEIKYVNNGSNKLLWASDTQYLPKAAFTDINDYYNQIMNYVSSEYTNGNAAYFVHTGDIVDQNPSDPEVAADEWARATLSYDILDNNNVPYGVCAGNHDVGTDIYDMDYSFYRQYFSSSRFNGKDFYGGTFNDNENHYDLVTIGDYDFIILYLGYGLVAYEDVVNWANNVLAKYPNRNAIVATHAYLDENGNHDLTVKADVMFNEILAKNENVKFAFSGHTDGSQYVKQTFGDRVVYEILNCYQFVEKDKYSISHLINGYHCNGEGYMKSVEFKDGQVVCKTFSPIKNIVDDPYKSGTPEVTLNIDLIKANHTIKLNNLSICQIDSELASKQIKENEYSETYQGNANDNYMVLVKDNNNVVSFTIL